MDATTNAGFEEVIGLVVGLDELKTSLDQAKALWDSFIAGITNVDAFAAASGGAFSGMNQEIEALRKSFDTFRSESVESVQGVSDAVTSLVEKTEAVQEAAAQRQRQRARDTTAVEIQAAENSAETIENLYARVRDAAEKVQQTNERNLLNFKEAHDLADQEDVKSYGISNRPDSEASAQMYNEAKALDDKYNADKAELAEKTAERLKALEEDLAASRRASILDQDLAAAQATAARMATEEKAAATIAALEEDLAAKRRAAILGGDVSAQEATAARIAAEEKAASAIAALEEDLASKRRAAILGQDQASQEAAAVRVAAEEKANAEIEAEQKASLMRRVRNEAEAWEVMLGEALRLNKAFDDNLVASKKASLMSRVRNEAEAMEALHVQALEMNKKFDDAEEAKNKKKGIPNEFSVENIARLAQFVVLWQVLSGVINGVVELLESPFKALESGVTYLKELEATSEELAGVLDANVRYSSDLAENFRKASEVAPQVVKALQDAAVATHLDPNQLTNIFKSLADNGAAGGTKNTKELVDLATDLGIAFKATGASAQSVQRAVAEIPKFLEGTLPHGSKLLQILDLSSAAAAKLVSEGLQYHDLLERIGDLPAMKAHQLALASMKEGYQSALENLELLLSRLAGTAAAPLFEEIKKALLGISAWVQENSGQIIEALEAIGAMVGQITGESIRFLGTFAALPGVVENFRALLGVLEYIYTQISGTVSVAKFLFQSLEAMSSAHPWDGLKQAAEDFRKSVHDISDADAKMEDYILGKQRKFSPKDIMDSAAGYTSIYDKTESKTEPRPEPTKPVHDDKKIFDDDKKEVFAYVEQIKEKYKELDNATAESVSARTLGHKEAAEQIHNSAVQEINDINLAEAALKIAAANAKARIEARPVTKTYTQDKKNDDVKALDADQASTAGQFDKTRQAVRDRDSAARRAANAEEVTSTQEHYKILTGIKEDAAKKDLAYSKLLAEGGYLTQVQAFDQETAIMARQRQIKIAADNEELAQYTNNSAAKAALQEKMGRTEQEQDGLSRVRAQQRLAMVQVEHEARTKVDDRSRASSLETKSLVDSASGAANPFGSNAGEQQNQFDAKERELEILIREKQASLELAAARNEESAKTAQLAEELQGLYNQRLKDVQARVQQVVAQTPNPNLHPIVSAPAIQSAVNRAQLDVGDREHKLDQFNDSHPVSKYDDPEFHKDPDIEAQRAALEKLVEIATSQLTALNNLQAKAAGTKGDQADSFLKKVFGFDPIASHASAAKDDKDGGGGITGMDNQIADGANDVAAAFKGVVDAAKAYQEGYKQGGVLGGAGALMSQFSGLAGAVGGPLVGAIVSSVGSIMSTIGGLFTQAAQDIVNEINKDIARTMQAYSDKQTDLVNTIAQLQADEQSAISQLSGTKGGQDQLSKLLPGLQQQISSLQQQALNTVSSFNSMTANLNLQNSTLSEVNQEWASINQQVADYLSSGGNANTAAQALSATLQQIEIATTNSLNQANDTAIQDAITLNGLLQQKLQLTMQYNQQVFAVTNQGSIERQQGAVTQGQQLAQLAAQYAQQSNDLQAQINIAQQKVALESQVFDIATNINDLHAQDAKLQIDALQQQIIQWTAMQKIVQSISQDASGMFSVAPGLFNPLPTTITLELALANFTLTATGTLQPGAGGSGTVTTNGGTGLSDQLQQQLRNTLLGR